MTLVEQLRIYIHPNDSMEDHDDIRALMIAGADRIVTLEAALRELIDDMGEVPGAGHHRDKWRTYQVSPKTIEDARRVLLFGSSAETPAPSKGKPIFNYNGDLVGYEPETGPVFTLEQRDWIRNNYEALIAAGWRNPSVSETKGEPK